MGAIFKKENRWVGKRGGLYSRIISRSFFEHNSLVTPQTALSANHEPGAVPGAGLPQSQPKTHSCPRRQVLPAFRVNTPRASRGLVQHPNHS